MNNRSIRIDDKDWNNLVKLSKPENVSILIRKVLREFLDQQNTNSVVGRKNKIENQSRT